MTQYVIIVPNSLLSKEIAPLFIRYDKSKIEEELKNLKY